MDNLLSGLIGALIAVVLTVIFSRIFYCSKLNKIRKSLLMYTKSLASEKLDVYISNMKLAINLTSNFPKDTDSQDVFDAVPQLTSEIFKAYSPSELWAVSGNANNYYDILDTYFCIDFLKENLALSLYDKYTSKELQHFEEKGIKTLTEKIKHQGECEYLRALTENTLQNMNLKLETATTVMKQLKSLENHLGGNNFKWVIKYFFTA